jgi:hypothetical protein
MKYKENISHKISINHNTIYKLFNDRIGVFMYGSQSSFASLRDSQFYTHGVWGEYYNYLGSYYANGRNLYAYDIVAYKTCKNQIDALNKLAMGEVDWDWYINDEGVL